MPVCPSVRPHGTTRVHRTDFRWIRYLSNFFKICREPSSLIISDKTTGTLHDDQNTFVTISLWILRRMRNVSDKICREKTKHNFMFKNCFRKSCRLWYNVGKYCTARQATDDNIIWRMRIACWIAKTTDPHSEYVMFIVFPLQQWLHERAPLLRYTYIACLVCLFVCYLVILCSQNAPQNCLSGYRSQVTMSSRCWALLYFKLMIWTWAIH